VIEREAASGETRRAKIRVDTRRSIFINVFDIREPEQMSENIYRLLRELIYTRQIRRLIFPVYGYKDTNTRRRINSPKRPASASAESHRTESDTPTCVRDNRISRMTVPRQTRRPRFIIHCVPRKHQSASLHPSPSHGTFSSPQA